MERKKKRRFEYSVSLNKEFIRLVFAQEQEENEYASANLEVTADFPDNTFGRKFFYLTYYYYLRTRRKKIRITIM